MNLLAVAFGGALGALCRYGVYQLFPVVDTRHLPLGTLFVNVAGSLLIGVAYVLILEKMSIPAYWRPLLTIGFLGAFTTFSTFALEVLLLIEHGEWLKSAAYVVFSVVFCIVACLIGIALARLI